MPVKKKASRSREQIPNRKENPMQADPNSTPLEHLAARVAGDPYFLASTLAAYQQRHDLDDAALAALLGCNVAVLTPLRLCRRPGAAEPSWTCQEDVAEIARRFCLDARALGRVAEEAAGS
jgi:hypothetical protein